MKKGPRYMTLLGKSLKKSYKDLKKGPRYE